LVLVLCSKKEIFVTKRNNIVGYNIRLLQGVISYAG